MLFMQMLMAMVQKKSLGLAAEREKWVEVKHVLVKVKLMLRLPKIVTVGMIY